MATASYKSLLSTQTFFIFFWERKDIRARLINKRKNTIRTGYIPLSPSSPSPPSPTHPAFDPPNFAFKGGLTFGARRLPKRIFLSLSLLDPFSSNPPFVASFFECHHYVSFSRLPGITLRGACFCLWLLWFVFQRGLFFLSFFFEKKKK